MVIHECHLLVSFSQPQPQPYKEPEASTEVTEPNKTSPKREKVGKRRRSAPAMYVKQHWNSADKNLTPLIPKL